MTKQKVGGWTKLSARTEYENAWIKVEENEVLNPNGGKGIYGVVHFKNLAIGIIPIDSEGYTWIVGQDRYPLNGKFTWEIIEGGGPLDIDPLVSAKRELLEEAGIKAGSWKLIQEMDLSNSATTERALIYVAKDLSIHEPEPDETEKLVLKKIPFEELYKMVIDGEITDSLSVAGVLKCKLMMEVKL